MNKLIYILTAVFLLALVACKKTSNGTMTVVKDCTGTYLNFEGKDYHVCNPEKISSFSDGAIVKATFKKLKECDGSAKDMVVCMMMHDNEGWIDVEEIK